MIRRCNGRQGGMNLWILQHYATPPDTVSGTRHFNIAKMLSGYGYDVSIVAAGFNHSTLREERLWGNELSKMQNEQGVRFLWVKTPGYSGNGWKRMLNMLIYSVRAHEFSASLKQRPDIVFASNPHLFSGIAGYLLAKKWKCHFIFEVRDLWPQVFVDIGAFGNTHPLIIGFRFLERVIYNRAEKIIVLMPKASEYIQGYGVDPSKIVYLPHALDVAGFEEASSNPPAELEEIIQLKMQGKFIVGYLGAHGIADALDTVIDCCVLLREWSMERVHIVMIGHGSEKERLAQRAKRLTLPNISFFQAIQKQDVPAAIKLFDIGIVSKKDSPLYKYGTSFIKTFDYMACGVPILWAVNSPDCPVVDAGCGVAIPAESPQHMAEAVTKFADMSDDMRMHMGRKGLAYVRKNHDNKIIMEKLRAIFESL